MRLQLFKKPEPEPKAAPPPESPELLRSGVLLTPWFILYRLDEEMRRARRYQRRLSVIIAAPAVLPGERLAAEALYAAAEAAQAIARSTDLVGWIEGDRILTIMPETTPEEAKAAASRLLNEMWLRGRSMGGKKWSLAAIEDASAFETTEQLIFASADRLIQQKAA
jgi:hypothetical protein